MNPELLPVYRRLICSWTVYDRDLPSASERAVSKVIASPAAVISEDHANSSHAYCAEAKGSC